MPHIAGRDRQQVMGKRAEHALDGRFQVRTERRQRVMPDIEVRKQPYHLPGYEFLSSIGYHQFGNAPVEEAIPCDAGTCCEVERSTTRNFTRRV